MPPQRPNTPTPSRWSWLPRTVIALGVVSLFTDTATEMIVPLLPVFVTSVLGGGALALGLIEGSADAVASILKLVVGRWADRIGKNRPFVLAGYSVASVVRPLVALATQPWHVLAVRVADRVGKGLRTSPRDSMIAVSVPPHRRGTAFSFHRAMDHAGAVLGPLVALGVLALTHNDLREVFWLTAIPGALAVLTVLWGVREAAVPNPPDGARATPSGWPSACLLRFLIPVGLFTLGNASDVFLLLKANAERTPLYGLPLLWMGLHVVKSLSSIPGGRLADRKGARTTISLGWGVYILIYVGFALTTSRTAVIALFLAYGLYYGLTEGPEKALVSWAARGNASGTAFGWYYLTVGCLTLPASLLFGGLWDLFGSPVAFGVSAALAAAALVALYLLRAGAPAR